MHRPIENRSYSEKAKLCVVTVYHAENSAQLQELQGNMTRADTGQHDKGNVKSALFARQARRQAGGQAGG